MTQQQVFTQEDRSKEFEVLTFDKKNIVASLLIRPLVSGMSINGIIYENQEYIYDVQSKPGYQLELRSTCAKRDRNITPGMSDSGVISTSGFCGLLHLELYEIDKTNQDPIGQSFIDVHSRKLNFETSYRGMVLRLSKELAGLLADARSATHIPYTSTSDTLEQFQWMHQQLEILRAIIEHPEYTEALERVFRYPHEKLDDEYIKHSVQRQKRWQTNEIHQLLHSHPQQSIPVGHILQTYGINQVATHVITPRRVRTLNTIENRFIKYSLTDYLQFSTHVYTKLASLKNKSGWESTLQLAERLSNKLQQHLSHTFFNDIDDIQQIPFHSPVLQRKAGYRELLRWWIRFHSSMDARWANSSDIFVAGNRKTETLYEYWLFFVLIDVFEAYCGPVGNRHQFFHTEENGIITIKHSNKPIQGSFTHNNSCYIMQLSYNTTYKGEKVNASWTVDMRPDYTFTIWPALFENEKQALDNNKLIRVHFDAKYRVNNVDEIFNNQDDDETGEDQDTITSPPLTTKAYKRDDIRKMHAYNDAIHHTIGVFVLFPGIDRAYKLFKRYPSSHFPSIGAFSMSPDNEGSVQSLHNLHDLFRQIFDGLAEHFRIHDQTETP